jgi:hypothetical protein
MDREGEVDRYSVQNPRPADEPGRASRAITEYGQAESARRTPCVRHVNQRQPDLKRPRRVTLSEFWYKDVLHGDWMGQGSDLKLISHPMGSDPIWSTVHSLPKAYARSPADRSFLFIIK